ncbi:hypothetical protein L3i22_036480 [Actinoplanes sp. L3-i22]|nr:hypothetical protein L3i22_036480 [Actinoplanes sp. L3-i22]
MVLSNNGGLLGPALMLSSTVTSPGSTVTSPSCVYDPERIFTRIADTARPMWTGGWIWEDQSS